MLLLNSILVISALALARIGACPGEVHVTYGKVVDLSNVRAVVVD